MPLDDEQIPDQDGRPEPEVVTDQMRNRYIAIMMAIAVAIIVTVLYV